MPSEPLYLPDDVPAALEEIERLETVAVIINGGAVYRLTHWRYA